ncbi:di-trans,poly-cis-decaprenylcistransferase [Jiella marina]|uniref:di-trans,poly-cis-decaprenylcistransferase n=1 Tax=Jiella sp. LLJ827 TaxID=2917712 RepID=UPI0021016614|nr:di-trans,poly-cis-decaprenylcistransferase [Jiella sp. LLJ827]MCQ0988268.1 di-trans,poly-cis-decaprenylcistransferase [Jiella sp. LLJ827]
MQSNLHKKIHAALIMDGNGRWATWQGLPRSEGHEAGVRAIRPVVEAAADRGIGTLTLYAFSSDNWRRPQAEIDVLMGLLRTYLDAETKSFVETGVRLGVIGRRDRLPDGLAEQIAEAERMTAAGERIHLRIAFDYSARDRILAAARQTWPHTPRDEFGRMITGDGAADVDLLIRTGGERRLSDFLLFESAYAELVFIDRMWPDFRPDHLDEALAEFARRQRRFGGLTDADGAAKVA